MPDNKKMTPEEKTELDALEEGLNMTVIGLIKFQKALQKLEERFGEDPRLKEIRGVLDEAVIPYSVQLDAKVKEVLS